MPRILLLPLVFLFLTCNSLGIKLSELKVVPASSSSDCKSESEVRTYRVLFLLPFFNSQVSESALSGSDSVQEIREYAKPWDIGFTILGFLFSLNSSTTFYQYCNKAELQKLAPVSENLAISMPYFRSTTSSKPAEQLLFPKDDFHVGEAERVKLVTLAQGLLKSEEKFQIILVGKSNTSGDIAYQTRLTKRRAEEIKTILTGESLDGDRINTVFTEKDFGGSDSFSTIEIFLVKE